MAKKTKRGKGGYRQGRRKSSAAPVLLSLVLIVAAAFGVAVVWQNFQDGALAAEAAAGRGASSQPDEETLAVDAAGKETLPSTAVQEAVLKTESSQPEDIDKPSGPAKPDDESDIDEPVEATEPRTGGREQFDYALSEREIVPLAYFNDALFIGDSITTGLTGYKVVPNSAVVADIGIQVVDAATRGYIKSGDKKLTLLEAAAEYGERSKIYIMLGGNSLGYDKDPFISGYREFIAAVKAQYPEALIYLQTMPPVTDYAHETYPSITNERLEEYNLAIQELARSERVYLVDVAEALMDEEGKLPEEASPVDGMHFTPEYYAKWLAYLRTHTAPEPK
ncbi:GDSL-type esterase/lipase family protein [Ruminococcaceae bacterium OttesenSCG-928-L11]|nr:GDSL-type esterase/lipase family protein [Ruminococcaceae bacterium OttesenSCG-928-L11]